MVIPSGFSKDETFETHKWKTQFAAERCGSTSPNLYSKFRKLLRAPPVRNAKSPTFSNEELDALTTSNLPYQTNYTYANSELYDPSLPDHWEVPNISMASSIPDFEEQHWAAVSLSKRVLYFVTLPIVLTAHIVLYILNSLKNGTAITVLTILDYFVYIVRQIIAYWSSWFATRQSSVHLRNYKKVSVWSRIVGFLTTINEYVWALATSPYKSYKRWRELKQYEYKSIRGDLQKEREERGRQVTISELRKIRGPSFSPARGTRRSARLTTTTTVFSSEKANENDDHHAQNDTPIRSRNSVTFRQPVFDTPDRQEDRNDREDTPLSVYGLRSRNVERNTPEPTYEAHLVKKTESAGKSRQRAILKTSNVFSSVLSPSTVVSSAENSSKTVAVVEFVQRIFSQLWSFAQTVLLLLIFLVFIPYEIIKFAFKSAWEFMTSSETIENFYNRQLEKSQYVFDENESIWKRILGFLIYSPFILFKSISNACRSFIAFASDTKSVWPFLRFLLYSLLLLLILFFVIPLYKTNKHEEIDRVQAIETPHQRIYTRVLYEVISTIPQRLENIFLSILSIPVYLSTRAVDLVFEFFALFTGTPNLIAEKSGKVFGTIALYNNWILESIFEAILWTFSTVRGLIFGVQEAFFLYILVPIYEFVSENVVGAYQSKNVVYGWFAYFGELIRNLANYILALIFITGQSISAAFVKYTERPPAQTIVVPASFDQAALKAEIYQKLRAEIKDELNLEFSNKYQTIINDIKSEHNNINIDGSSLEALIRKMIYEYDSDKTGLVDYALESSGASVLSTRCSETYNSYSRLEKIWSIPLWYSTYGPRTVIQRNSKTLFPGECWSFKSGRGYLTIDLSHRIDISSVSYEHIGKELAPDGNRQSAPKNFKIWAYQNVDDISTRYLIGEYIYDLDGPTLQFFPAQNTPGFPVKIVELEVNSNYGSIFTCLYRLRVHGKVNHS